MNVLTGHRNSSTIHSMARFHLLVRDSRDVMYPPSQVHHTEPDHGVFDRKPYFEKKDVILCRSGIQEYSYAEVLRFGLSNPPVKKQLYKVYRPASVIIASLEKMKNLPITKEHPPEFVDGDNWQRYAHGYTGSEAEIVSIGDGEIGVKSKLVFSTKEIYNYYLDGSEEVSLGYQSVNEWAYDNPEYDIIMTGIVEVNHCAVTAAGRGGSRVAIIDSLIGGMTMFKTGLMHFLKRKGKTADSSSPLSKIVFDSLEVSKNLDGAKLEAEVTRVMDSLATLKDSEHKTLLVDVVTDCYKAIGTAIDNKEEVAKVIDSLYAKAEEETIKQLDEAMKPTEVKDEDGKGTGTKNISDSEDEKPEEKKEEMKKEEEKKEEKKSEDSASFDSALAKVKEDLMKELLGSVTTIVRDSVKEALGLSNADSAKGGSTTDDSVVEDLSGVDIEKFI